MFDGLINTASLKERIAQSPLVECYGVKFKERDSYYMVIPIDGKRLVLSTWRIKVAKPFRRSDSLISEAESFGFTSIKFGASEEQAIAANLTTEQIPADKLSALKFFISFLPSLGIKLKIPKEDFDSSKIDDGIDIYFHSETDGVRVLVGDLIRGNVEIEK
ncbi:hypothetical protein A1QO_04290 [Vibrio genomosp. F10 str. ZF-129]|uniref:Uncharacterized protein n=1 Tax=Vibrio genomosp. F10 str. ZF-129 TaxID=1187848 RepID=A0A1E5BJ45_9VIBR|nr:hypothetical protein [Vibrio genomosp. F10]OEE37332.1 hypothetical protein A1QO_04290 [Vibrio genomosp. F10 str. ZF-129]